MSEQVGADLPEARDGEGQLSMDALGRPRRALRGVCDVAVYLLPFVSMRYSPVDLMGWAAKRT